MAAEDTRLQIRLMIPVIDTCHEHGLAETTLTIGQGEIGKIDQYEPGATHVLAEFPHWGRVAIPINAFEMLG